MKTNEVKKEIFKDSIKVNISDDLIEITQKVTIKSYYLSHDKKEKKYERERIDKMIFNHNSNPEDVKNTIKSNPDCTLYRVISNYPILTHEILNRIKNVNSIANNQIFKYEEDCEFNSHKKGDLILDTLGRPQFKLILFKFNNMEDIDLRSDDPLDYYQNSEIKILLNKTNKVLKNQLL